MVEGDSTQTKREGAGARKGILLVPRRNRWRGLCRPPAPAQLRPMQVLRLMTLLGCFAGCAAAAPIDTPLWGAKTDGYYSHFVYGITVTAQDTVLVATEARVAGPDAGEKRILLRRSTDRGAHWSPDQIIEGTHDHFSWSNPTFVAVGPTVYLIYSQSVSSDVGRVFVRTSQDDGVSWSERSEITALWDHHPDAWTQHSSIGHGLVKALPPAQGGVFVAMQHRRSVKQPPAKRHYGIDVIQLTPQGWRIAGTLPFDAARGPGEAELTEDAAGALVLIARQTGTQTRGRAESISTDGGAHWSAWRDLTELKGTPCDGGLIQADRHAWLYTYPASTSRSAKDRADLTVALSEDGGRTWPVHRLLHGGHATYSDLAKDAQGNLYCIFGNGGTDFQGDRVDVARFTLDWVRGAESKAAASVPPPSAP